MFPADLVKTTTQTLSRLIDCACTTNVSYDLPDLRLCDRLSLRLGDVVIHAPGFEDRTLGFATVTDAQASAGGVLLDYRPFSPGNRLREVRDALSAKGVTIADDDILPYHRFQPGDFEMRLRNRLVTLGARRAVIDISSMSKLAILLVLNVCRTIHADVAIFYSEAAVYGPSEAEFETARRDDMIHRPTLQVFTGVHGVVRVDSLASVAMQGHPTAALVFMSFNDALTQVLLNTVYPSRLLLIGSSPKSVTAVGAQRNSGRCSPCRSTSCGSRRRDG